MVSQRNLIAQQIVTRRRPRGWTQPPLAVRLQFAGWHNATRATVSHVGGNPAQKLAFKPGLHSSEIIGFGPIGRRKVVMNPLQPACRIPAKSDGAFCDYHSQTQLNNLSHCSGGR